MTIWKTTTPADGYNLDAFGRQRFSDTGQRFDIEFTADLQPDLICRKTSNNGETIAHRNNESDVKIMLNGVSNGLYAYVYSHYDVPYTPGNSQEIALTGLLDGANLGGTCSIFLRSNITGTPQDLVNEDQSSWLAKQTGVNWNDSHIFLIDLQSLKVGRLRVGIVADGKPVKLLDIYNDNIRQTGYWQLATLPVAWRMYCDGTSTFTEICYGDENNAIGFRYEVTKNSTQYMTAICATVKSEGGLDIFDMPGFSRTENTGVTSKTVSSTLIPILSIKPRSLYGSKRNYGSYIPIEVTITTDNPILLVLVNGKPTLANASWLPAGKSVAATAIVAGERYVILSAGNTNFALIGAADSNVGTSFTATGAGTGTGTVVLERSGMEYDLSATALSGGVEINSTYITSTNQVRGSREVGILGKVVLALGRDGMSDILSICAVRTTNTNAAVFCSINWKEIR